MQRLRSKPLKADESSGDLKTGQKLILSEVFVFYDVGRLSSVWLSAIYKLNATK